MSEPILLPNAAPQAQRTARDPREAIAQASQRTGADFDYLLAQARLESGLNPAAKASTSSASGLYQFIDSTWLETLDRHGENLGLGSAADAIHISNGRARVTDGSVRNQIMALRFDPSVSALMAGALANDNRNALSGVLGRAPDSTELYMAHFLGAAGASKFLQKLAADPDASAAAIFPAPASANRAIFYKPGGAQRSLGEVMGVMRGKMANAMALDGTQPALRPDRPVAMEASDRSRPITAPEQFHSRPLETSRAAFAASTSAGQSSMADLLKTSFGTAAALPPHAQTQIQSAYARLKAFDL